MYWGKLQGLSPQVHEFLTPYARPFFFTRQLLPLLRAGAASSPDGKARIVNTASSAADLGKINVATFRDGAARKKAGPNTLYNQSKLGTILISNELARRYAADGIISVALNPGNLKSELQRHLRGPQAFIVVSPLPCAVFWRV
jgi:retinol dehydrogenase-12